MMPSEKRYVTIPTINWIPPLSVFGPILNPRYLYESTVHTLVCSGFEVYEHAVTGKYAGAKVKLTVRNFSNPDRFAEDTSITPHVVDITKNFGAAVNGQAKAVDPTLSTDPVKLEAESDTEDEKTIPKVATPITGNMSKSQRKKAAKEAARAAAAAKAAESDTTGSDIIPDPTTEVDETTVETTEDTVTE